MSTRHKKAFTLLEVMVALAIISIALIVLLKNSTTSLKQSTYLQQKTLAHWVAQNQLQRLYLAETWLAVNQKKSGQEVLAGINWNWTMQAKATLNPDLRRVTIEISLADELITTEQGFISHREK